MSTPPGAWKASKTVTRVARLGELAGGRQAGRPGAHDGHAAPGVRVVAALQLVEVLQGPVGHEALQGADRHRLALLAADAETLALRLLGADAAGDAGEGVVIEKQFGGPLEVARRPAAR